MGKVSHQILLNQDKGFRSVFDSYYPGLLRFVKEYVKDNQDAEDIMQNVFLILWEKRNFLKSDTNLNAYLFTLAKSQCLNYLKHLKVVDKYVNVQQSEYQENYLNYYAIDKFEPEQIDIESLELMVEKAINDLPEQCRKVFELSRYEGLKYKEIAQRMGISVKTVESHMANALKTLRLVLKDSFLIWLVHHISNM